MSSAASSLFPTQLSHPTEPFLRGSRLNPRLFGHDGNSKGCSSIMLLGLCSSLGLARSPAELSNSGHRDGVALDIKDRPLEIHLKTPKLLFSLENSGPHIQLACSDGNQSSRQDKIAQDQPGNGPRGKPGAGFVWQLPLPQRPPAPYLVNRTLQMLHS